MAPEKPGKHKHWYELIDEMQRPLLRHGVDTHASLSVVVAKVAEATGDFGYNAKTDEYTDMLKAGIIDPKKVTRVALENAASVSGMILTTECALIDIKEENAGGGMPMGGGMPGMM